MAVYFYGVTAIILLVSCLADRDKTIKALTIARKSLLAITPRVLAMVLLVGLALALVTPDQISRLFQVKGVAGFSLVALVGTVITIPAPIAFPLAGSLVKLGASLPVLAVFITTLTMVGTVTAPLEISYFGLRFTVARQSISLATAVIIGLLMGLFL